MLEVQNLSVSLGGRPIVKAINFQAKPNDIIAFLGPNGAGKTTCMRLLSGVYKPSQGNIKLSNFSPDNNILQYQSLVGFLPEGAPLYGQMTVKEFLEFIAGVKRVQNPKEAIIKAASFVELQSVFHNMIDTLSKGFRRRVALAAALLGDPKLLILDEPSDGLDPNQKLKMRAAFESISLGRIVIISTHILDEAVNICNRIIIFQNGEIKLDEDAKSFRLRNKGDIEKTFFEFTQKAIENA